MEQRGRLGDALRRIDPGQHRAQPAFGAIQVSGQQLDQPVAGALQQERVIGRRDASLGSGQFV